MYLPFVAAGLLGAEEGLAHPVVRNVHLHQRRTIPDSARRGLGRLDSTNKIRPEEGQWHVRMPGMQLTSSILHQSSAHRILMTNQ